MTGRVLRGLACVSGLWVMAAGCGTRTPGSSAYRNQTESAVAGALTAVATTRIALQGLDRSALEHRYAVALVEDSPDGSLLCKVDDVEMVERDGRLVLTALLGETLGRWGSAIWRRLSTRGRPGRISFDDVGAIGRAIRLADAPRRAERQGFECWAPALVIRKIPGARDEP